MFSLVNSNGKDDQELRVSDQLSTALSLSTGSVNNGREFESREVQRKIKRKKGLDCAAGTLTIGTGSSSVQQKWCASFGSGFGGLESSVLSRNKSLIPISDHHQSANGRGVAGFVDRPIYDKIHSRILKNREPAARSRARKLAVEAQQQHENSELKKENDILKNVVRFLFSHYQDKTHEVATIDKKLLSTILNICFPSHRKC